MGMERQVLMSRELERRQMVESQIRGRGITDGAVLRAMAAVPRERFVPAELAEQAYDDGPLSLELEQTISQPYIVALMAQALELQPGSRVLEIGTGSGYSAAVLARMVPAGKVFTIERHEQLATGAERRLRALGVANVSVRQGDGTLGWPEAAPFDAIVVAAGGPSVPPALVSQLAPGGRLVMPVGASEHLQKLVRVRRAADGTIITEPLTDVRFVPLIGVQGWQRGPAGPPPPPRELPELIRASAEPIHDLELGDLGGLVARLGRAQTVLLGEATHGTREFYRLRARLSRELILHHGFRVIAVEADWPDAAHVDRYIRGLEPLAGAGPAFARFPTWMWRNTDMVELIEWLRAHNQSVAPAEQVRFHGLDIYSLATSMTAVVDYLGSVDPDAQATARRRYGCLEPWQADPGAYGLAAHSGDYPGCEHDTVATLRDLLDHRLTYAARDGERFFDAVQNARLVANAEKYYRVMYRGARESWNLRDQHMFDTLRALREHHGAHTRMIVWAHNSHLGDAAATEMGVRGEHNVGQLVREAEGERAVLVGFDTDHGTVAAAHDWDSPMRVMGVRPARPGSYEAACHQAGLPAFCLPLREPRLAEAKAALAEPRLERAIGVIYRPDTELESHYFQAVLPRQFDEYVWIDETHALTPLAREPRTGMPDTYPFGV
jgi:protein-L-isoaspartate(D-aspartate) O-methyltransferase